MPRVRVLGDAEFKKPRYVRVNTNVLSRADAIEQFTKDGYFEKSTVECKTYDDFLAVVRNLDALEYVSDMHVNNLFVFASATSRKWALHEMVKSNQLVLQDKVNRYIYSLV